MIITAWTIDDTPANWSAVFKVSEIQVICAPCKVIVTRPDVGQLKLTTFVVVVGSKEIPCCRESSDKSIPFEHEAEATLAFHKELIKLWGEAQ
jgi:hypothetical protein